MARKGIIVLVEAVCFAVGLAPYFTTARAEISLLASTLGLNQTWNAPYPSSNLSSASTAQLIRQAWGVGRNTFFGNGNIAFVNDPFNSTGEKVLQVFYANGSYTPQSSKYSTVTGGVEFYATPFGNLTYDRTLVSYQLGFDADFPWNQGGKLPGVYGGDQGAGCSGGNQATGNNCFSMRLMWRSNAMGEAYAYIPVDSTLCTNSMVICNTQYGQSIGRGSITFTAGTWNQVDIYTQLNTINKRDRILQVWINGTLQVSMDNLLYHSSPDILINSVMFSTFFGGSTSQYAAPHDTHTYFKGLSMSVGNPVTPQTTPASSDARRITATGQLFAVIALSSFFCFL